MLAVFFFFTETKILSRVGKIALKLPLFSLLGAFRSPESGSLSNQSRSSPPVRMTRAFSKALRLPKIASECPSLAHTAAQAPRFRGPGRWFQ